MMNLKNIEKKIHIRWLVRKVVGSISGNQLLSNSPKEIADRLATCPQMCSYIDLLVYRKKGQHDWLVQSFAISSSVDLSDYV